MTCEIVSITWGPSGNQVEFDDLSLRNIFPDHRVAFIWELNPESPCLSGTSKDMDLWQGSIPVHGFEADVQFISAVVYGILQPHVGDHNTLCLNMFNKDDEQHVHYVFNNALFTGLSKLKFSHYPKRYAAHFTGKASDATVKLWK